MGLKMYRATDSTYRYYLKHRISKIPIDYETFNTHISILIANAPINEFIQCYVTKNNKKLFKNYLVGNFLICTIPKTREVFRIEWLKDKRADLSLESQINIKKQFLLNGLSVVGGKMV